MEKMIIVKPKMLTGEVSLGGLYGSGKKDFCVGAYFLAAGAIGNDIVCKGKDLKNKGGISKIIDIIQMAGGEIIKNKNEISAKMTAVMKGIDVSLEGEDEILPAVALLCAFLKGESHISGLKDPRGTIAKGVVSELNHLGIYTEMTASGICITGGQTVRCDGTYARQNPYLATMLILLASRAEGEFSVLGIAEGEEFQSFMELYNGIKGESL